MSKSNYTEDISSIVISDSTLVTYVPNIDIDIDGEFAVHFLYRNPSNNSVMGSGTFYFKSGIAVTKNDSYAAVSYDGEKTLVIRKMGSLNVAGTTLYYSRNIFGFAEDKSETDILPLTTLRLPEASQTAVANNTSPIHPCEIKATQSGILVVSFRPTVSAGWTVFGHSGTDNVTYAGLIQILNSKATIQLNDGEVKSFYAGIPYVIPVEIGDVVIVSLASWELENFSCIDINYALIPIK